MRIQLSEHFSYKKLLKFVLPSIVMMVFTSIYSVVDGVFVSNFVGKTSFAAVNLIMPITMGMGSIGFMLGTGGSAIVSKTLGEGDGLKANKYFTMIVISTIIGGFILTVIGLIYIRPIAVAIGATENMLEDCLLYGRILIVVEIAFMLQNLFQSFFVTAEKPQIGLLLTILAGLTNIILDAVFIAVFHWGVAGAAVATAMSQVVGGIVPIFYFIRKNDSVLKFTRTNINLRILLKVCTNGSSELMTNLSTSIVNILYNFQLMKIAGEDGVAAYGVIMYVNFIFMAIYIGYSIGSAPIVGYHFGAENYDELKNLFKKSLKIVGVFGFILTFAAIILASPLSKIFVGYDIELFEMTKNGFRLYSLSFLISGFNVFGSAFFTALNNGMISAAISFLRTLLFQVVVVMILPIILGLNGIWLSVVMAELFTVFISVIFFIKNKNRYHYA
ncbi:MAG: MATE family efflux transporter [Clostridia bacterium]|nr:MATE family efflux transporter [Clostridia bacterium]